MNNSLLYYPSLDVSDTVYCCRGIFPFILEQFYYDLFSLLLKPFAIKAIFRTRVRDKWDRKNSFRFKIRRKMQIHCTRFYLVCGLRGKHICLRSFTKPPFSSQHSDLWFTHNPFKHKYIFKHFLICLVLFNNFKHFSFFL